MRAKLAVFLHFYYQDLLPEFLQYLSNFEPETDIYVNIPSSKSALEIDEIQSRIKNIHPNAVFMVTNNIGRDTGGFLRMIYAAIDSGKEYDFVCFLHTKKNVQGSWSLNRPPSHGHTWRRRLCHTIVGSRENIETVVDMMRLNPTIGMVGSEQHIVSYVGRNRKNVDEFVNVLGIDPKKAGPFIAGTIFWVRWAIYKKVFASKGIDPDKLGSTDVFDGQPYHALERVFGYTVTSEGYRIVSSREAHKLPESTCLFSHSFLSVEMDAFDMHYVEHLRQHVDKIIVITDVDYNPFRDINIIKVPPQLSVFDRWSHAVQQLPSLADRRFLILADDRNLYIRPLHELMQWVRKLPANCMSLSECGGVPQTDFCVFDPKAVPVLCRFLRHRVCTTNSDCLNDDLMLAKAIDDAGCTKQSYFPSQEFGPENDVQVNKWQEFINAGSPFIRKECVLGRKDGSGGMSYKDWQTYVRPIVCMGNPLCAWNFHRKMDACKLFL